MSALLMHDEGQAFEWSVPDWLQRRSRIVATGALAGPRIVLFDDDPIFSLSMELAAKRAGLSLVAVSDEQDLSRLDGRGIDLAVVDFDLGDINGIQLAESLAERLGPIPMVLVSFKERRPTPRHPWPGPIKRFFHKQSGPAAILDGAVEVYNLNAGSVHWTGKKNGQWRKE
jgi:CheY-like chemotaxis protein